MIADNDRIRTEHEQRIVGGLGFRLGMENRFGFLAGETFHQMDGIFTGTRVFADRNGLHLEREARLGEKFATSRRCGGKNEHGFPTKISS